MGIIDVIGAMDEELAGLRAACSGPPLRDGFAIRTCGVGKVNATLAVACAQERGTFGILSVGTAGALDPELHIGDVVIVTRAMQHDVDASAVGFPRGTIPFEEESTWHAHELLINAAAHAVEILRSPVRTGTICSGERFIADPVERAGLHAQFGGTCVDMETGAIAHACAKLRIPWVGIRIISDRANGDAAPDFPAALAIASAHIARVVPKIVARIPNELARARGDRARTICPDPVPTTERA